MSERRDPQLAAVQVIDHPLVAARLSVMRDKRSDNATFRLALAELTTMLLYETMRGAATEPFEVETPVAAAAGNRLREPVLLVPILRAGLGMLDSATRLIPEADIGFVGMARDEHTHEPHLYMESLPQSLDRQHVIVLDPMLATGGSLISCIEILRKNGARKITVACVLAAPEGLARVMQYDSALNVVTASIDEKLDGNAFIVPGLGDAGDRQFGAV